MSNRMTCPACDSHTSGVWTAYREGDPCPYCGLPWAALNAVKMTQERSAFRVKLAQHFANRRVGDKALVPNEDDYAAADALIESGLVQSADTDD